MTIGIAIPTYVGHKEYLTRLLDSIAHSTVMPTEVSISISECGFVIPKKYPFDVILNSSRYYQNTAKNTNVACSNLTTDIISLIGGDDMVHPRRCEFILSAFDNPDVDVVVHNFLQAKEIDEDFLKSHHDACELYVNYIDTLKDNIPYPVSQFTHYDFANGFVSFRRKIFKQYKFNEAPEYEFAEDALFNRTLVENGYKISYIKNKLALYLKNPNRK